MTFDPLGRRTEYGYNTVGDVTSITRLAGTGYAVTWNLGYDVIDNFFLTTSDLRTITDPLQHTPCRPHLIGVSSGTGRSGADPDNGLTLEMTKRREKWQILPVAGS